VNAGATSNLLDGISTLTVNGAVGTTLNLDDQSNTFVRFAGQFSLTPLSTTYLVTNNNITRNDIVLATDMIFGGSHVDTYLTSINYSHLAALTINGGNSPNRYTVRGSAAGTPTTVNAGGAGDNVTVGNAANSLADIQGALTLDGQAGTNFLTFNDQGATGSPSYALTANSLTRSGAALMTFQNFVVQLNRATSQPSVVVGRQLFYHNSPRYDVSGTAWAPLPYADDNAIATDKSAYLPGGTMAGFGNYSSYSKGINGIMGRPARPRIAHVDHASQHPRRFHLQGRQQRFGGSWANAPLPIAVNVRTGMTPGANGAGAISGSDRVEIIWADGAIKQQWLEVIVKPTAHTGLVTSDVFFFGNEIGNTAVFNTATVARTGASDLTLTHKEWGQPGQQHLAHEHLRLRS